MGGHSVTDNNYSNADFAGYRISDQKTKSTDATVSYIGYVNKFGNYYIMKQDKTNGTFRYYRGEGDYTTAWAARETLTYDYFYEIFGSI